MAIVSDVFKVMGCSFQTIGAATEKACLPKFSLVLGTGSCEIHDLSCLWIFERCRRLAKLLYRQSTICTNWQFKFDSISCR